jgi:hypothetical protein
MELGLDCVVKTAIDKDGNILWRAIYVNNKKEVENFNIDLKKILKAYAPNGKWKDVKVTDEDVYSHLEDYFPEVEDFTYLLDYSEIEVGKTIFLFNGKNVVTEIWDDYRPAGDYDSWHWEEIDKRYYGAKTNQYFQGHNVTKFVVEGSDEEYVWEDWNYQQSFLYLNYKQHGN